MTTSKSLPHVECRQQASVPVEEARKDVVQGTIVLLILNTLSTSSRQERDLAKRITIASGAVASGFNQEKLA